MSTAVLLGIDFGGTKIAVAVCAPTGERLASAIVPSGGVLGARASFNAGIEAARDVLARAPARWELAAIGVSTFGVPHDDRVELAPAIDGWDQLALREKSRPCSGSARPGGHRCQGRGLRRGAVGSARGLRPSRVPEPRDRPVRGPAGWGQSGQWRSRCRR